MLRGGSQISEPDVQADWRIRGPAGVATPFGLKPTTLDSRTKTLELQRPC